MKNKALGATGLVAAGLVAGIVLASTGASAETSTATTLPSPTTTGSLPTLDNSTTDRHRIADNDGDFGRHGGHGLRHDMNDRSATPIRDDEKELSASDAAKVKAAAEAAVAGGTVFRVETDAGDGEYEAHIAKADGTLVTIKFDANFKVIATQDGMGFGDPRPKLPLSSNK